ncbi:hypothetical protein SDC9_72731 [bioreactor metagenome]|uniref:Uncharacterized protein n=1 Tax=bioreactor metagenome TaxID=1076179 RepID=A0A644YCL0_9ZZZZ
MKSDGKFSIVKPKKSLIWVEKITRAIPLVKPTTMRYGMNLIMLPNLKTPISTSMTPARMVAINNPENPKSLTIPKTITMNAPVGPPIRYLEPPKREVSTPATIAVIKPCCGVTPEAIPNAIARGRAIIPTITPAIRSEKNVFLL